MQIEKRSVTKLANDPNNVRIHSEKNINAIIEPLSKNGYRNSLVFYPLKTVKD